MAVEHGRIVGLGSGSAPKAPEEPKQPGDPRVILPAVVNAHVHLELSWMRGAVPPASSMPAWASQLMLLRRAKDKDPELPITKAVDEARSFGTALVGEVTNTLASYGALERSHLFASVFFEQIGFKTDAPIERVVAAQDQLDLSPPNARIRHSVVPHAPYSVSPGMLRAIGDLEPGVVSIHLAESPEEVQFLNEGTGAWRTLLETLGVWDDQWVPPRCGPVEYIGRAGLLNERLVAVHGVQLTEAELSRLAEAGATLVTCPRSNVWTGAGLPPVKRFYESAVRVAVGTDSLASVDDLNVFSELAAMRAAAPDVPARRLLESATQSGAEALGFGAELGTLEPGKRAELIAVRLRDATADVEEYLVGGIQAEHIRWLEGD